VTKTFTAATTLTLVADGSVSLDDTLDTYVTGFPNGNRITIRQLLNHTAGTFDITDDSDFMAEARSDPSRVYAPAELIAVAAAHDPVFEPGEDWGYSNTNYLLLGMVIEAATGQDAAAAIRERALEAVDLGRTYLEGVEDLPELIAPGYGPTDADVTGVLPPTIRWTAGAMVAEVGDIAAWIAALARGDVLPPAEQEAMLTSVPMEIGDRSCGLGIFFLEVEGVGPAMGHSGGTPGYHTVALYVPSLDAAAVAIVNSDRASPKLIVDALLAAVAAAE
jgi:D-alanyl-D-alanine carboxypeptidase